jgi:hypothetical protein
MNFYHNFLAMDWYKYNDTLCLDCRISGYLLDGRKCHCLDSGHCPLCGEVQIFLAPNITTRHAPACISCGWYDGIRYGKAWLYTGSVYSKHEGNIPRDDIRAITRDGQYFDVEGAYQNGGQGIVGWGILQDCLAYVDIEDIEKAQQRA